MVLKLELRHLDLSLDVLRQNYPDHYRRWVGFGIGLTSLAYVSTTVALLLERGWAAFRVSDPYVALIVTCSLVVWRAGRPRRAALITVLATVLDITLSLLFDGMTGVPTTQAISPLLMAVGLWLGGRAVLVVGLWCAISVPIMLQLGQALGFHAGFGEPHALHVMVASEACLGVTVCLLVLFLTTFSQTLQVSQDMERRERDLQQQLLHAQKLEALGLLAGGIAHDFNNLLTAVAGYGSLLATSTDPEAREFAGGIMAAQERGTALIRPLLAFARQEIVEPKALDLSSALTEMVTLLRRLLGERCRLELEANEVCPIVADAGQLEQIVVNLAANARDAMAEGGTLSVRCQALPEVVVLTVRDTGQGMSEETCSRIFEPFFTTKERGKGTGLGLAMVHGLVTSFGGTIAVTSAIGQGTTFTLTWPRSMLPIVDELSQTTTTTSAEGTRTILMAEDNDSVRAIVKRVLERAGYQVLLARNGEEALEFVQQGKPLPDLLLTDVIMPGMTGPDLLERMRQNHPGLRYLFMSGYLGEIAERYDFDPEVDLITKPFSPMSLLERIEKRLHD